MLSDMKYSDHGKLTVENHRDGGGCFKLHIWQWSAFSISTHNSYMSKIRIANWNIATGRIQVFHRSKKSHSYVGQSTASWLWNRCQRFQSAWRRPPSAGPRITTAAHDRWIQVQRTQTRTFLVGDGSLPKTIETDWIWLIYGSYCC